MIYFLGVTSPNDFYEQILLATRLVAKLDPLSCMFYGPYMIGRKTVLDQFHTDPHDPARDPKGHILHVCWFSLKWRSNVFR